MVKLASCIAAFIKRVTFSKCANIPTNNRRSKVVLITGCDSGLGWAMARRAVEEGLTVVAGFLKDNKGRSAELLTFGIKESSNLHCINLDITNEANIADAVKYINNIIEDNPNYVLHAVVNNAGVMTFGEFEWFTPRLINQHINVNLIGTMMVTHKFLPLLRTTARKVDNPKPRIITVTSHCAIQPLPKLSVYCATKAASSAWTEALRLEVEKYGLRVIKFVPGSFVTSSNIILNQEIHSEEMKKAMGEEQLDFYGKYFDLTMRHLSQLPKNTQPNALNDNVLLDKFSHALCDEYPKNFYKHEPWIYRFYHCLFRMPLHTSLKDRLVFMFMKFPSINMKR